MDYLVEKGNEGRFVAIRSFLDRRVAATGLDPERVLEAAREAGAHEPVVFFVPDEGVDIL